MKILIADDHAILRKGLIEILRGEFSHLEVYEAANGNEAIAIAGETLLDLILLDISMPGRNGIETLKQIRAMGVKAPLIILSVQPEDQYAIRVLKAGATGFLNKDSAPETLVAAVHRVMAGRKYVSASVAEKLVQSIGALDDKPLYEHLSDRELEVLRLLASGKAVSDVAKEISLSVNTISTYRHRVLQKLQLSNNAELTRYAMDHGLV